MQVNPCIDVKDFIGDPGKMAGGHFSGMTYGTWKCHHDANASCEPVKYK